MTELVGRGPTALTPERTVADLAGYLGAPLVGDPSAGALTVRDISDDSRTLSAGDAYLAFPGSRWHGLDFHARAAAAGAVVAISDRPSSLLPTVIVDDPRAISGPLCDWFHGSPSAAMRVFGVTGTNGKTSTSHFLEAGLAAAGETTGLISGAAIRGPGIGLRPVRTTPEASILQRTLGRFRRSGVTACAVEVSSHAVDQHRVDGMRFRTMAFTNLGRDHLDYHGTMESYYRTKASLFTAGRAAAAVICVDDGYGRRLAAATTQPTWTCSVRDPLADVYADGITCEAAGTRFVARTPLGRLPVCLRVLGPHQIPNAVAALTTLLADGLDPAAIVGGLESLRRVPGRCEPVHAGQAFTAIVDYMHNESGQRALLPFLRSLAGGRLIVVIGATGGRDRAKRGTIGYSAASFADVVIVTDESPNDEDPAAIRAEVLAGARRARRAEVVEEPDRGRAFALAVATATAADVVVVTGRGSDRVQRFGPHAVSFDDHARLMRAITAAVTTGPAVRR